MDGVHTDGVDDGRATEGRGSGVQCNCRGDMAINNRTRLEGACTHLEVAVGLTGAGSRERMVVVVR